MLFVFLASFFHHNTCLQFLNRTFIKNTWFNIDYITWMLHTFSFLAIFPICKKLMTARTLFFLVFLFFLSLSLYFLRIFWPVKLFLDNSYELLILRNYRDPSSWSLCNLGKILYIIEYYLKNIDIVNTVAHASSEIWIRSVLA
jgi:hypothetical protein